MKKLLLSAFLIFAVKSYSQCPISIQLTQKPNSCLGTTLTVSPSPNFNYAKIDWYRDSLLVHSAMAISGSASGNGFGTASNQLLLRALFVASGSNIYVTDVNNSRILEWRPGASSDIGVLGFCCKSRCMLNH